ncbi:uncharacterized protein LOC134533838 isoform X2 [Bacillus rossius redtenbacheri]|uniref:uncharacterized protein LOC134533838 isoform X2 n=1 Tax=Bacillus rossius redtenbacheri TaxID=93214 RepID=UPI002FDD9BEB
MKLFLWHLNDSSASGDGKFLCVVLHDYMKCFDFLAKGEDLVIQMKLRHLFLMVISAGVLTLWFATWDSSHNPAVTFFTRPPQKHGSTRGESAPHRPGGVLGTPVAGEKNIFFTRPPQKRGLTRGESAPHRPGGVLGTPVAGEKNIFFTRPPQKHGSTRGESAPHRPGGVLGTPVAGEKNIFFTRPPQERGLTRGESAPHRPGGVLGTPVAGEKNIFFTRPPQKRGLTRGESAPHRPGGVLGTPVAGEKNIFFTRPPQKRGLTRGESAPHRPGGVLGTPVAGEKNIFFTRPPQERGLTRGESAPHRPGGVLGTPVAGEKNIFFTRPPQKRGLTRGESAPHRPGGVLGTPVAGEKNIFFTRPPQKRGLTRGESAPHRPGGVLGTPVAGEKNIFFTRPPQERGSTRGESAPHRPGGVLGTPVAGERNIFFVESRCGVSGQRSRAVSMRPRQACAVESAALTNPASTVYYLDTCLDAAARVGSTDPYVEWSPDSVVDRVLRLPNVKVVPTSLAELAKGTPLGAWSRKGDLLRSAFPIEHSSDVIRLLALWKYGGIYLDLDFIFVRSLDDLGMDFVVAERSNWIANGAISFSAEGLGHAVVGRCLKELETHFDGNIWSHNGPALITKIVSMLCNTTLVEEMTRERCWGFTVHPPALFYPFRYESWWLMFDEYSSDAFMAFVLKNSTYAVHAWNKLSHARNVRADSRQPFALLARRFCPTVFSAAGPFF